MTDYKKELEEFTYIVSHDLNAPLRHINQFGKLLVKSLGNKIEDNEKQYIHFMEQGLIRAEKMMEALLEYSRLNTSDEDFTSCDCNEIVKGALGRLKEKIETKKAIIDIGNLPDNIMADEKQLMSVFYHLIENALIFSKEDEPPKIEISAEEKENAWVFTMKDNGIGIPEKAHDRIFQIFQQLDPDNKEQGIGKGLAISKKIIERHEGSLSVSSEEDKGTALSFTIPRS